MAHLQDDHPLRPQKEQSPLRVTLRGQRHTACSSSQTICQQSPSSSHLSPRPPSLSDNELRSTLIRMTRAELGEGELLPGLSEPSWQRLPTRKAASSAPRAELTPLLRVSTVRSEAAPARPGQEAAETKARLVFVLFF